MIIYDTGHIASETVCAALQRGLGWEVEVAPWNRPLKGPCAFYGRDRGTMNLVRQMAVAGKYWLMVDNGYITPRLQGDAEIENRFKGYYKVSRDGFQCDGTGRPDFDRLDQVLELTDQKFKRRWRAGTEDGHILICPPIKEYERVHHFSHGFWLRWVRQSITNTDCKRKMRVRYKPGDPRQEGKVRQLKHELINCHAVVTVDSNIATEAIMAGVPCFVTGTSPAQVFGNVDLATIDYPRVKGDRRKWLAILANNQWTLKEISEGRANHLMGQGGSRYENRRAT